MCCKALEGRDSAFSHHSPFLPSDRFAAACSPVSLTFKISACKTVASLSGKAQVTTWLTPTMQWRYSAAVSCLLAFRNIPWRVKRNGYVESRP